MSATRVEPAYVNGTGPSAVPNAVARSEAFYEKLVELHRNIINGKNPRLTLACPPQSFQSRNSTSANILSAATTHTQTEPLSQMPGLDNTPASHPFAPLAYPSVIAHPTAGSNSTPTKTNNAVAQKKEPTDDPTRLKIIQEARRKLERAIAEYAKADEPILKNAREIPLNLLALAHAQVAPVSGLKHDLSEDSFDEESYYSSKANSWSTEHTEPQLGQTDNAIVISDEDDEDLYEPPSKVDGSLSAAVQPKLPSVQHLENTNSNGDWEPDWDEEDDYEPPAPAAFGGSGHSRSAPQRANAMATVQRASYGQQLHLGTASKLHPSDQVPTIAVNQISAPAAPQPSRISPLATGNITHTMQTQINSLQQNPGGGSMPYGSGEADAQGNNLAMSAKELKRQRRLARREAKAAVVAGSSKKRKRGATPERQQGKKGKRRVMQSQHDTPEPYIKPEPMSPPSGLATIPSRRPSEIYRDYEEAGVRSSSNSGRPATASFTDQGSSPWEYRYPGSDAEDRVAMPPPKTFRRGGGNQDLRRVASLQHARRPLSPGQEYPVHADPRVPPSRYGHTEPSFSRGATHREASMRPSSVRPAPTPSPPAADPFHQRFSMPVPRPGQIVTDAYGNRYIAELVQDDYQPPSRRAHPDDYHARYPPQRRADAYDDDAYRLAAPTGSRAYSTMPEPAPIDRRSRAYSHVPEPAADTQTSHRAYSVHPSAAAQQWESHRLDDRAVYNQHRVPSRYEKETSPRSAYAPEFAPMPRAFSARPDASRSAMHPEYSRARAGSIAPARRGEMAPPILPVMQSRDAVLSGERYSVPGDARGEYGDRRVVTYRY